MRVSFLLRAIKRNIKKKKNKRIKRNTYKEIKED